MKRTVLPLGYDGAYLQPRGFVPQNAQTTGESYDFWVMGIEIENFHQAALETFTPKIESIIEAIVKPFLPKIEALIQSLQDEKAKERRRSWDDVNKKRREMRKRKGRQL